MTVKCILSMTQDAGVQIAKDSRQSYDGCPCEPEVSLYSFYTARYDYGERYQALSERQNCLALTIHIIYSGWTSWV